METLFAQKATCRSKSVDDVGSYTLIELCGSVSDFEAATHKLLDRPVDMETSPFEKGDKVSKVGGTAGTSEANPRKRSCCRS